MTNNFQIIISSDSNSNPEQTPLEATFSPQDEIKPQVMSSSKTAELFVYALKDKWTQAKLFYDQFHDMVRIPLTSNGDTALHVAVSANSAEFVEGFVELEFVTPDDLQIPNADGNTPFCLAAVSGNDRLFEIMIQKKADLPLIPCQDGMLPVHLAVLNVHHKIVQDLSISSENLLHKMDTKDIERLFFMTISGRMYDVATKLLEKYRDLAIARDDHEQTALHMLAQKPEDFDMKECNNLKGSSTGGELLAKLWSHIRQMEHKKTLDLISKPSAVLFDAVKYGNINVVKCLLDKNPELVMQKESDEGWSVLHFAILHRQSSILKFMLKMPTGNLIIRAVDKEYNNALHLAAHPPEASSSLRSNIQMHSDLVWFQEVEKSVPPELKTRKNIKGMTPKDLFYDNHKELWSRLKDEAKEIANYDMIVATLIATVVFAAALTVPGDKASVWFIVFILTNAVAFFCSSASIISFLSVLTSTRLTESEFINSQLRHLILGVVFLCYSILAMLIAFVAASFLIFEHKSKWVAYVVAPLGILPIYVTGLLLLSLRKGNYEYIWLFDYYNPQEFNMSGPFYYLYSFFKFTRVVKPRSISFKISSNS